MSTGAWTTEDLTGDPHNRVPCPCGKDHRAMEEREQAWRRWRDANIDAGRGAAFDAGWEAAVAFATAPDPLAEPPR